MDGVIRPENAFNHFARHLAVPGNTILDGRIDRLASGQHDERTDLFARQLIDTPRDNFHRCNNRFRRYMPQQVFQALGLEYVSNFVAEDDQDTDSGQGGNALENGVR